MWKKPLGRTRTWTRASETPRQVWMSDKEPKRGTALEQVGL